MYAVEVTNAKVGKLVKRAARDGYTNVEAILGKLDDPLLPDQSIDLAFFCNSYHHIDNRPAYFARLRTDLRRTGRVAIVEFRDDLAGIKGLFVSPAHSTPKKQLYEELEAAGYEFVSSFDYLPDQHFELFAVQDDRL